MSKAKAAQMLQKGCNHGISKICVELGIMHADGDGVPQDKDKAEELYQKACDAGLEWGCLRLSGWTLRAQ